MRNGGPRGRREGTGVFEVEVLPLRRRAHLRPLPDGLRVAECGLEAGPRHCRSPRRREHVESTAVIGSGTAARFFVPDLGDFFAIASPPPPELPQSRSQETEVRNGNAEVLSF